MMKRPIAIDLFAGCGGLSLGIEQAGFDVAAAVEIDPIHCAVHEYNFPNTTTICADVKELTGDRIRELSDLTNVDIDLVVGGAPCQGFSLIGKRMLDDPRNQLIGHFLRLVSELKPKYCILENVKGLTIGKHIQFLNALIDNLKDNGYEVLLPYKVLNAADFGVPQKRQRLFLMAARKGLPLPSYPQALGTKITVHEAIGDLPNADDFDELVDNDEVEVHWKTKERYAKILRGLDPDPQDFSYPRKFNRNILTSSARTEHTQKSKDRFALTEQGSVEPISRFLKLSNVGQCNTLRAGTDSARGAFTSPRPIHPEHNRVITVREAARLHSYPDWFRFNKTKWHGFREIGNSVPPLLARAVGSEIIKALGISPISPKKSLKTGNPKLLSFDMSQASAFFNVASNVIPQRKRVKNEK